MKIPIPLIADYTLLIILLPYIRRKLLRKLDHPPKILIKCKLPEILSEEFMSSRTVEEILIEERTA